MTQEEFKSTVQLHQAGKLNEAEAGYRRMLAGMPTHSDALHLLGIIHAQRGQFPQAEAFIRQAISIRPDCPEYYRNLGNMMVQAQQFPQAIACYRQVACLLPNDHVLLFQLTTLLVKQGDLLSAAEAVKSALVLQPDNSEYRTALAMLFMQTNRPGLAAAEMREAVRRKPDDARSWHNLGASLSSCGQAEEALGVFDHALKLDPKMAIAHCNKSAALRQIGRHAEALAAIRAATEIDPTCPGAQNNLGALLYDEGKQEETLAAWRLAVAQEPASPAMHWNLARILLRMGQLAEGWEEFESRLHIPAMRLNRGFAQPQWNGSDPTGKTILLYTEGGYGDALNFIRHVPEVTRLGGRWLLECQPELVELFRQVVGIEQIIPRGQPLPDFDMHIPLQSLPRILKITLETIPDEVPYLKPPADRVEFWSKRLVSDGKLRVGLVWSGSAGNIGDERTRSIDVFAPLATVPNIKFYSLQKGGDSSQPPPAGMDWTDFTSEIGDFADAAAFLQNLDLLISVDTSTAHLAGALARPVWVLIPFQSDFRWLANRTDTPWYPTMRLFREPVKGDSATPVAQMVQSLRELASKK